MHNFREASHKIPTNYKEKKRGFAVEKPGRHHSNQGHTVITTSQGKSNVTHFPIKCAEKNAAFLLRCSCRT